MKGKITDANGEKDFDTSPETLTPSPSPLPGNTSSGFATFSPSDAEKGIRWARVASDSPRSRRSGRRNAGEVAAGARRSRR